MTYYRHEMKQERIYNTTYLSPDEKLLDIAVGQKNY